MLVEPFKSVGNLLFTDTRQQIRGKLNESFVYGLKEDVNDDIKDYYDYFEHSGLFVYYDENDNVNAFEFFQANPVFNEVNLLTIHYNQLVKLFMELDTDLDVEYDRFTSYKYGVGASTNDDPESEMAIPEAIIIFRKGYYDLVQSYISKLSQGGS
jgi:hypothetical protein